MMSQPRPELLALLGQLLVQLGLPLLQPLHLRREIKPPLKLFVQLIRCSFEVQMSCLQGLDASVRAGSQNWLGLPGRTCVHKPRVLCIWPRKRPSSRS